MYMQNKKDSRISIGEGSKIGQICQRKKFPTGGGRGQNRVKFTDVLNGWYLPKTKEASA